MSNLELKGLKGLRGLDSLLGAGENKSQKINLVSLQYLPLDALQPGKYQPRNTINETQLEELATSIKSQGIIQPLIVRRINNCDQYEIIAGERRWRAAKISGLVDVPVIIRDVEDNTALAFSIIENIQRENLNPIEEAIAFSRLQEEFALTHAEISEVVGRSRATVTNTLRLLNLSDSVKELLSVGQIEMGHARALLTLDDDNQLVVAQKIIENNLSARDVENLVQSHQKTKPTEKQKMNKHAKINYWQEKLSEKLTSKVIVNLNENGRGKIVIHVESSEEIDWIIEHMKIDC